MNPKDIYNDAIHNFHPQYQQYTQYQAAAPSGKKSGESSSNADAQGPSGSSRSGGGNAGGDSKVTTQQQTVAELSNTVGGIMSLATSSVIEVEEQNKSQEVAKKGQAGRQIPTISQNYTEKTTLLSSDDEFQ